MAEIGSRLPVWLTALLAVSSYFVFRHFANSAIITSPGPGDLSGTLISQLIRTGSSFAQYLVPGLLGLGALVALTRRVRRIRVLKDVSGSNPKRRVDDLSWREFEQLTYRLFEQMGYTVYETKAGPDDGVDLRLRKGDERATVQCKHWKSRKVPVQVIREQLGIVTAESATLGIIVTTGAFTKAAYEFARGKPLELVDGKRLQAMMNTGGVNQIETATPKTADNEIEPLIDPLCPKCNGPMAMRIARRGKYQGRQFWGCERYPKCRGVRSTQ